MSRWVFLLYRQSCRRNPLCCAPPLLGYQATMANTPQQFYPKVGWSITVGFAVSLVLHRWRQRPKSTMGCHGPDGRFGSWRSPCTSHNLFTRSGFHQQRLFWGFAQWPLSRCHAARWVHEQWAEHGFNIGYNGARTNQQSRNLPFTNCLRAVDAGTQPDQTLVKFNSRSPNKVTNAVQGPCANEGHKLFCQGGNRDEKGWGWRHWSLFQCSVCWVWMSCRKSSRWELQAHCSTNVLLGWLFKEEVKERYGVAVTSKLQAWNRPLLFYKFSLH